MSTPFKLVQTPAVALYSGLSVVGATAIVTPYPVDLDGTKLTMADFGDTGRFTVDPKVSGYEEICTFTGMVDNGNNTCSLTGLTRDLISKYPYTTAGTGKLHGAGAVVVFSDNPQVYSEFPGKRNDETISGLWSFTQTPLGLNAGAVNDASTVNMGILRLIGTPNKTIGTFTVTVATPAVFTLNAHGLIANDRVQFTTTGALPTGLATSTTYYVISTGLTANAFEVSTVQGGTAVNTSGTQSGTHTLIRTTPLSPSDQDWRLNSNYYAVDTGAANAYVMTVTNGPTAYASGQVFIFKAVNANTTTSTLNVDGIGVKTIKKLGGSTNLAAGDIAANAVVMVEYDAGLDVFVMLTPTSTAPLTSSSLKFGGTGADGALTITSGATNIDCLGAAVVVKNYTSISITGTASLTFTNPHANGTIIILKSQGNVTLTSSTAPMIDVSAMGATGGVGVTPSGGTLTGNNGTEPNATTFITTGRAGFGAPANNGAGNTGAGGAFPPTLISPVTGIGKYQSVFMVGAGGGSGGDGGGSGTTGAGGRGGGGLIIECAGAWNFTTASGISVAGQAGGAGGVGKGNGGGGGAGFCYVQYATLTANSGTITVTGGASGTGASSAGYAGGGGASQINNGLGGGGQLGAAGVGGAGWSSVISNVNFT